MDRCKETQGAPDDTSGARGAVLTVVPARGLGMMCTTHFRQSIPYIKSMNPLGNLAVIFIVRRFMPPLFFHYSVGTLFFHYSVGTSVRHQNIDPRFDGITSGSEMKTPGQLTTHGRYP